MTQPRFSCSPAEQLRGLQAQPGLLRPPEPPRDPVEKPRGDGETVKKPWAYSSTAQWDSAPGQPMVPENPEVLRSQHPSPAQGEDFYPTTAHQETGEGSRGERQH